MKKAKTTTLSTSFDRLLKSTPEEKEARRIERLTERSKWSLALQLGFYVGEQIVRRHLPTLSVDGIHTNVNISVTCAEGDECRRLNDVWFNKVMNFKGTDEEKRKATESEWNALRAFHQVLEEKYLPKIVECNFGFLNITEENMKEFKEGISMSLWDCDCSHYSTKLEDIEIKPDEDGMFTMITLKKG